MKKTNSILLSFLLTITTFIPYFSKTCSPSFFLETEPTTSSLPTTPSPVETPSTPDENIIP